MILRLKIEVGTFVEDINGLSDSLEIIPKAGFKSVSSCIQYIIQHVG